MLNNVEKTRNLYNGSSNNIELKGEGEFYFIISMIACILLCGILRGEKGIL